MVLDVSEFNKFSLLLYFVNLIFAKLIEHLNNRFEFNYMSINFWMKLENYSYNFNTFSAVQFKI